jgi:nanoRNase/pAp phosphatase (c-di-AMP/oligoRNAs hydrolase)
MSLTKEAQFLELLKPAEHPLILLPPYPSHDAIASGIALSLFALALGKKPTLAAERIDERREDLGFLVWPETVLTAISGARDFVLSFNTEHNNILDVRTERLDKELRIHLTPTHGTIDPRDFSFILAKYKFDVVLTVDAPDKESLGKLYEDNPDIFYEVPIINIDRHSNNEQYGQLNLVDVTASSASEIVAHFIETVGAEFIDTAVAEALLTGIMSATDSFQKKNTTPKTLQLASALMGHGADQQKIVKNLYKTQPLHILKLWGRIMGNIRTNDALHLMWAPVTLEDLVESRSKSEDLPVVLDKIRNNYAGATVFALFFKESATSMRILIKTQQEDRLEHILSVFSESHLVGDMLEGTLPATDFATAERLLVEWFQGMEEKN